MKKELRKYNKINSYGIISIILFSLIFTSIFLVPTEATTNNIGENNINDAGLVEHESIYIGNDAAFETYGFPGNGSVSDPYRIENLNITTTDDDAIIVIITSKHFIIQNCYLQAVRYGIYLHVVSDYTATLLNNTIKNTDSSGVYLLDSDGVTIANNSLINNKADHNLYMRNCENVIIANNTVMASRKAAVLAEGCTDCIFYFNHIELNVGYGLVLYEGTEDCIIFHNNFIDNKPGNPQVYVDYLSTINIFYNLDILEGNFYNNWIGEGNYTIGGTGDPVADPYPLAEAIPNLKDLGYDPSNPRPEPVTTTPPPTTTPPLETTKPSSSTEPSTWSLISILSLIGLVLVVHRMKRRRIE